MDVVTSSRVGFNVANVISGSFCTIRNTQRLSQTNSISIFLFHSIPCFFGLESCRFRRCRFNCWALYRTEWLQLSKIMAVSTTRRFPGYLLYHPYINALSIHQCDKDSLHEKIDTGVLEVQLPMQTLSGIFCILPEWWQLEIYLVYYC